MTKDDSRTALKIHMIHAGQGVPRQGKRMLLPALALAFLCMAGASLPAAMAGSFEIALSVRRA